MNWIKRLIILCSCYLLCFYSNAQHKLLPLTQLAKCKIYKITSSDTSKKSEAYINYKKVKALHYFQDYNFRRLNNNLPFDSVTFPDLQFLILDNVWDLPENLSQFKNLQCLFFINNNIMWRSDLESEYHNKKPKYLSNSIYQLKHLKILYSNALAPYKYDGNNGFTFYYDVNKLKQMKELQLIDLPDGLMDDKIVPVFFTPNIKVLIQSKERGGEFLDARSDVKDVLEKQNNRSDVSYKDISEFQTQSNSIKFINKSLHRRELRIKKQLVFKDVPYNEVLKSYVNYLNSTKKISPQSSKEFTVYKDDNFEYSCNLIEIPNADIPLLDTNEVKKNKLYQRYGNFTRFKVQQNATYYYYPKSNAYIINTTYYNGLDNYRQDIKWYSPISSNKVHIKWIQIVDEKWESYDYEKTKTTTIKHNYQIKEKFNKEIIIK